MRPDLRQVDAEAAITVVGDDPWMSHKRAQRERAARDDAPMQFAFAGIVEPINSYRSGTAVAK